MASEIAFLGTLKNSLRIVRDKHRVTVAKKAIFLFYRSLIGVHRMLIAGKSRDQHNQRRFRQMKVGHQRINDFVLIARVDENLRIVEERLNQVVFAACAALSSERTDVVPTAITRLPRAFAASTASTTSCGTSAYSECMM